MGSSAERMVVRHSWLTPATLLLVACSAANVPSNGPSSANSSLASASDAGTQDAPPGLPTAVADAAPEASRPETSDSGQPPPREYSTERFSVKVAPATRAPCVNADASLEALHFSNACVEQSAEGVRLGIQASGGAGLSWRQIAKQDQGRTRFIEIEESVPKLRPGESRLMVQVVVLAVLPLSSAPGKYTLRVNEACVPFEVTPTAPANGTSVRTCINDVPFEF